MYKSLIIYGNLTFPDQIYEQMNACDYELHPIMSPTSCQIFCQLSVIVKA